MKQLEKLMLTVGLLDRVTKPMRGIQRTIQQVTSQSRKAFENTAAGVTALMASAGAFMTTISPANDLNNALREVSSLDVAEDTLKQLNQAGMQYSIEFGEMIKMSWFPVPRMIRFAPTSLRNVFTSWSRYK